MARTFRNEESYEAERQTRAMLVPFLAERGFKNVRDERKRRGLSESQVVHAIDQTGRRVALWVRLCWRQSGTRKHKRRFSAAQLISKVRNNDWIGSIQKRTKRALEDKCTHLLLVQRMGNAISYAAVIPLTSVVPIWIAQRDKSAALINQGKLRRKKNHAMNGVSPTLWLEDESAPEVAKVLWNYKGVRDLVQLPLSGTRGKADSFDDSLDDLPGLDDAVIGRDGANQVLRVTSGVSRSPKVRLRVYRRSKGQCEREGCKSHRTYQGFLDVHHILGAINSDRVWNCVALCPNCHREAHASPDRDKFNAELLRFASKFKPSTSKRQGD